MVKNIEISTKFSWVVVDFEHISDIDGELKKYDIDNEILAYALDRHERARVEYRHRDNSYIVIFHGINPVKTETYYNTIPVTFVLKGKRLMTIVGKESSYIIDDILKKVPNDSNLSEFQFLFLSLRSLTEKYFPILEEIDVEKDIINNKLRENTTKNGLFALADLETGLMYLLAASNCKI